MRRKLRSLNEFFFSNWEILSLLVSQNIRRMLYSALIFLFAHLFYIYVFWMGLEEADGTELIWKTWIIYSHIAGAFICVTFGTIGLYLVNKKKTNGWLALVTNISVLISYLVLSSFITAVDQLVTTSIAPFLILCTGLATTYVLTPGIMIMIYTAGFFVFVKMIETTQKDLDVFLSNQVNGLTAVALGISVSIILYLNHKARIRQEAVIVSQKKALEEKNMELIKLNKAKSDFLSIAAHDLKNPLSVIQGMTSLLLESESLSSSSHEKIYSIMQSARRMLHIITELLNINRMEAKEIRLQKEICDLNQITQEMTKTILHLANRKRQKIEIDLSKERLPILVDKVYLSEIIENLISNAIKYSDFSKNIYIKTFQDGSMNSVSIRDEGQGLTQEEQGHLFEKFARLSSKPTGGENSTGLGLFIVKKLTDAMEGKISCTSQKGEGSTFTLSFPQKFEEVSDVLEKVESNSLIDKIKKYNILVVDDDMSNRNLLKLFLKKMGCDPYLASSGKEAIEMIQNQKIDVIFLDMEMPDMDGFATKNAIKKLGQSPFFILCTGNSFQSDLSKELGFDYSLEKPIEKTKLQWILEKIFFS